MKMVDGLSRPHRRCRSSQAFGASMDSMVFCSIISWKSDLNLCELLQLENFKISYVFRPEECTSHEKVDNVSCSGVK